MKTDEILFTEHRHFVFEVEVKETNGEETLMGCGELFSSKRDLNLKRWNLDISAGETSKEKVRGEIITGTNFQEAYRDFTYPMFNRGCLEQSQIVSLVKEKGEEIIFSISSLFSIEKEEVVLLFWVTQFNQKVDSNKTNLYITRIGFVGNDHFWVDVHKYQDNLIFEDDRVYCCVRSLRRETNP